jgi:amino acid transporter
MGQDYPALRFMAHSTPTGNVPWAALILQTGVGILFLLIGTYEQIMIYLSFILNLFNLATVAAVWWLHLTARHTFSLTIRIAATSFLLVYGWATLYLFAAAPTQSLYGLGSLALSLAIYYLTATPRPKN